MADNRGHQGENQGEDDGIPEPIVAKGGDEVVQRDELHGFRVLAAHGFICKREIDRIDDRAEHENRDEQERGNHEEAAARREVIPERSPFAIGWCTCWRRCDGIYGSTHELRTSMLSLPTSSVSLVSYQAAACSGVLSPTITVSIAS